MRDRTRAFSVRGAGFIAYTALLIALGILAPILLHQIGIAGEVFLPMHFPVIIGGLLFGPLCGVLVGFFSPVLSSLLTGMPPLVPPILLVMIPELMTYGGLSGWLRRRCNAPLLLALLGAMVGGRIAAGWATWVLVHMLDFHASLGVFITGAFVTGLPGMIGQVVLIPLLVRRMGSRFGGAA